MEEILYSIGARKAEEKSGDGIHGSGDDDDGG